MSSEPTKSTSASEGTPLLSPKGAKMFIDDLTSKVTKSFEDVKHTTERSLGEIQTKTREVFSDENVVKTKEFATAHFNVLKESTITGNFSIRLCALFGAALLTCSAIFGLFKDSFTSSPAGALVEIYTLALAAIIVVLESQRKMEFIKKEHLDMLHKYALFLKYVWGRGCLYLVAGSLQLTQGQFGNVFVGCYVMFVGVVYIVTGWTSAKKLASIKKEISEEQLDIAFQKLAVNDKISTDQFWDLVVDLGIGMKRPEVEAAFIQIDKDDSDALTIDEIKAWYFGGGVTVIV